MTPSADAAVGAAYDERADEYIDVAGTLAQMDQRDRDTIAQWRDTCSGPLLDAGCGPGLWAEFLARGGREVRGIDLSAAFIAAARAAHPQLTFDVGSFRALPVEDGSLGGILSWYSLIHTDPEDVPAVLAEFARALAPGGGLLLGFFDGPSRQGFDHRVAPAWFWTPATMSELLADAGFEVTRTEVRGRDAAEISVRPHAAVAAVRSPSTRRERTLSP